MGAEPIVIDMMQLRNITLEDPELMREIVTALVDDASAQIVRLGAALERADATECARVAHSARGACGNVGAASLAAVFLSVEQEARSGNLSACRARLTLLNQELDLLRTQARKI